ncbi:MAG: CRISPR-associated endonuclease Cas9 [Chlamydiae bacterium]|nr:CRISPR-associated endonuclease Cas9 [Chlamydiota bacterium]
MRVLVIDKNKKPLMPCKPSRARELLSKGKAAVIRRYPFTIILFAREEGAMQETELKVDPGSRISGIALVAKFKQGRKVIWASNLHHRGLAVRNALDSRRALRRGRRFRNTRYRKPRFDNRTRPKGWLPPSLQSRVGNVHQWAKKLQRFVPISSIAVETVRFDTQKMQNPEISGIQYQQGVLLGYEIREYLLEKWGRTCAYCDAKDVRLEIDHIVPKSRGGVSAVSNLTICCRPCNEKKSNQSVQEFLKSKPGVLSKFQKKNRLSLCDTAAVNATRIAIGNALRTLELPITFWSGGMTKYNRFLQGYQKDHWIDAACVGESGESVTLSEIFSILEISATGRGSRQMCRVDRYGFPRTLAKSKKRVNGFQTGDRVHAFVPKGKKAGTHIGKVSVRSSGNFNIKTSSQTVQGVHARYCKRLFQADGYEYVQFIIKGGGVSSSV